MATKLDREDRERRQDANLARERHSVPIPCDRCGKPQDHNVMHEHKLVYHGDISPNYGENFRSYHLRS